MKISTWVISVLAVLLLLLFFTGYIDNFLLPAILIFLLLLINRIGRKILLAIIGLLLLLILLMQTGPVQNFVTRKVTEQLSKDLGTEVSIKNVSFSFFDKFDLDSTLIRDKQKDTLLYAASLKIRITDWFFLKDNVDLKYIGLENAKINVNRKDSVWNYQFIIDHFASSSNKKDTSSGKKFVLNIQKIDLKKVTIVQNDEWIGQKLTVRVGSMLLDAEKTDLANNTFLINSIDLDRPYFSILNFDGRRPESEQVVSARDTGLYFNPGDMVLKVKTIKLSNGSFVNMKQGDEPEKGVFDGANIRVNNINGSLTDVSFIKDTIKSKIDLSATERSGFELKKLQANFKFTPEVMEFSKLDIRTPGSRLGDYYAMHYRDFNEDMGAYIEHVIMDARFKNSYVSSDDIAYFAPDLSSWKKKAAIAGKFHGTVNDFKVDNLFLRTGPDMYVAGDLTMKGLPDMDKTVINFYNGIAQTNSKELAFLYPDIVKITDPNLTTLGNILYKGNFNGTIYDFTANGTFSSELGGVYTNLNLKLPKRGEPSYRGNIDARQFDLGKFIGVNSLGIINFKGKIEGRSFAIDKAKTTLDGTFDSLQFNGYNYKDITFKGAIEKQKFDGDLKVNDPNFDFLSSIQIDLSGEKPSFNIVGDLANADFKKLYFTKQGYQLTGLFDLNFSGRNIDEFLGSAKILNASLLHDSTRLDFDSLTVNSYIDSTNNNKVLTAESNQFKAKISGRYNILDLPNSFQLFLSKYYPAYINPPSKAPKDQNFSVSIQTMDFNKYADIIDSNLSGLNNVVLEGNLNTNNRDSGFYVNANIPYLKYAKYHLENAQITGAGSNDSLHLEGEIERFYIGDSLYFPNSHLDIFSGNDHSIVHLSTSANETLNNADLNADVYTMEDGVRIDMRPSSFVVNTKEWSLEKEGELVIRKNYAFAKNVRFTQGFQQITVETEDDDVSNQSNLVVGLKNLNLGDFTTLFIKDPRIEGLANGVIYLRDFYNRFNADADINTEQFRLDDDSIGIVHVSAKYNNETGKISFAGSANDENYKFTLDGYYNIKDSVNIPLNATMHMQETKVKFIDRFLQGLFSDIDGLATGDITIKGKPNSPSLLGQITLRKGELTVDYTQVHYYIDSASIAFRNDGIDFGKFTVKDKYNNKGTVRGVLYENGFKNMRFDFDMYTDKLLLLDTKIKDNQQFFGKAIGKATLSLKGPENNMNMYISGESTDTTQISINTSSGRESTDADFIVFKQYGTEIQDEKNESNTKLNVYLDLTATNKADISVILDQLTGDIITAKGNGNLKINIPAVGDMTMSGKYNIEGGSYNFNFQSFLRKKFILKPNAGSYIEWNGDPYKATMSVVAQYTAQNVTFNELLANTGYNLGSTVSGYRGDVYVNAVLTGKLTSPNIKFSFDFPSNSPIANDNNLKLFLDKINNDDNEMIKQVTWLIVFGSFAPYGQLGSGGNIAQSTGINTISQQITNELNKLVSNLLTKITGDKSLHFDINTSTYSSSILYGTSSSSNKLDRQVINLKVNQSILNDKVIFTFGTGLDFNISSAAVQSGNFQWLPDVSVEFVLSKDRKLRAIVFNKSSLDVTTGIIGRRLRQGISISYSFDFPKEEPPPPLVPGTISKDADTSQEKTSTIKGSK